MLSIFAKPLPYLLAAAVALSACQPSTPAQPAASDSAASAPAGSDKVYNVAMNANFPPFESIDSSGKIYGFDVDLMDAMARAGNFKVHYKNQPWDGIFATLKGGDNDILISGITITDERRQTMAFSEPYFEVKQVILVPKGQNITSVNDLNKLDKVGVTTGTTGDLAAQKILGVTSAKIARFESLPLVIKEIENGGVQAMVSDSAVVANYVLLNSSKGFTMVKVPDFTEEHYGIAVAKDNQELLTVFNSALKQVKDSGEYQKIADKYFAH